MEKEFDRTKMKKLYDGFLEKLYNMPIVDRNYYVLSWNQGEFSLTSFNKINTICFTYFKDGVCLETLILSDLNDEKTINKINNLLTY